MKNVKAAIITIFVLISSMLLYSSCEKYPECRLLQDVTVNTFWKSDNVQLERCSYYEHITFEKYRRGKYKSYCTDGTNGVEFIYEFGSHNVEEGDSLYLYKINNWDRFHSDRPDTLERFFVGILNGFNCDKASITNSYTDMNFTITKQ